MKLFSIAFAALTLSANLMVAAQDPMVGGAKMYASKDIVDNAANWPTTRRLLPPLRRLDW